RTSVGLRRIVGTCQDPWSLASFPLWSSLDAHSLSGRVGHMRILISATVTFASVHSLSLHSYF
ncbi:hypothetical protein PILCRDRAFT_818949, partial [Piloderma croceum F 1598]